MHLHDLKIILVSHPTKLPAMKLAGSETDPRFVPMAVNVWESGSVTRLVDTAKTLRNS